MSRQVGNKARKKKNIYGSFWDGHNIFGDGKPTIPMFWYKCPDCPEREAHTRKRITYCTGRSTRHHPRRMVLEGIRTEIEDSK